MEGLAKLPLCPFALDPAVAPKAHTVEMHIRVVTPGTGTEGLRSDSCLQSCEGGCLGELGRALATGGEAGVVLGMRVFQKIHPL